MFTAVNIVESNGTSTKYHKKVIKIRVIDKRSIMPNHLKKHRIRNCKHKRDECTFSEHLFVIYTKLYILVLRIFRHCKATEYNDSCRYRECLVTNQANTTKSINWEGNTLVRSSNT